MAEKTSLYIPDRIRKIIGATGDTGRSLSGRISDIVDRYGEICARHRPGLVKMLTDAELRAIARAVRLAEERRKPLRLSPWEPAAAIFQGIAEAVADCDDPGRGVDRADLVRRLTALSYEQSVALLELVSERAWR